MNLEWSETYNSGIPEIDVQHQRFLLLVKNLYLERDVSKENKLYEELYRYAVFHFACEEELMRVYSYPEADKQKESHHNLLQDFSSFLNTISQNSLHKEKFLYFLVKWFVDHTTLDDRELGKFISLVRPV